MMPLEEHGTQDQTLRFKSVEELAISAFLKKLFEIVEDEKLADIVSWSEEGDAVIIKNPVEFSQKILPTYFKHNNLASFIRQLNMYNFHKRKSQQYEHVFSQSCFRKGRIDLLQKIRRKTPELPQGTTPKPKLSKSSLLEAENASLKQENDRLKRSHTELEIRINMLENKIMELNSQNQMYLGEIKTRAENEERLKQMVNSMLGGGSIQANNHSTQNLYIMNTNNSLQNGFNLAQHYPQQQIIGQVMIPATQTITTQIPIAKPTSLQSPVVIPVKNPEPDFNKFPFQLNQTVNHSAITTTTTQAVPSGYMNNQNSSFDPKAIEDFLQNLHSKRPKDIPSKIKFPHPAQNFIEKKEN